MFDVKSVLASKTVWVNIIGFLASLPMLAKYFAGVDISALAEQISAAATAISFIASTVFRIVATDRLKVGGA